MGELTDSIIAQATAPPTPEAMAVMRISVLDWIACGLAGTSEPVSMIVAKTLDAGGSTGQATSFDGIKRNLRDAALYNGTTSHALDYDDTHFAHIGHVSVGILPAALALAEHADASIDSFITAGLAGCEGAVRMGLALGRDHYQIGFHQTATAGAFGAALAAAQMSSCIDSVRRHALGLASTQAAGLKSQFGTMGKPYNAGLAASTGVSAVLLAQNGMVANPDGWDGPDGFIATHHGTGEPTPDGFLMPLVSHKFHACCHGLHAVLEALELLKPLDTDQIKQITIHTHPRWMTVCNKPNPTTGLEAKFSYRAVTAMSLLGISTAALDSFTDEVVARPAIKALMSLVNVETDPSLTEMQSRVTVTTTSDTATVEHDFDSVQTIAAREKRAIAKARTLIGAHRTDAIAALLNADAPVSKLTAHFTK